ncbi:MAG: hypothetical protein LH475_05040 [Cryobacterium sp.]|uniref:hypothetical protein n=1 Tax=Cryobacterium sp. TaxID=1926290 RepID=UPI002296D45B|nr:hypothetical protein [Cryobacterium sp.]MCY7403985.1 hypothetical protein [Cryobacterium sp.]
MSFPRPLSGGPGRHHVHDNLTPAALCAQAFAALQAEETADGSLEYWAADQALSSQPEASGPLPGKRARNWAEALHRHEGFWRTHGRSPRENTRNRSSLPPSERHAGEWARRQRRYEQNLTRYQVIRLDISPSFRWDPHEAAWQSRLVECIQHRIATGRIPYLNVVDAAEFSLARWLGRQMRLLQYGAHPAARAERLRAFLSDSPTP